MRSIFPSLNQADENGLLAVGGDLSIETLMDAYTHGIFPWPINEDYPLAWFSPDPRGILEYKNLHIPRSLLKVLKKGDYKITFNQEFDVVIHNCAMVKNRTGQQGTWITEDIINGYNQMFKKGLAYSVECWMQEKLAGGLYGVCLGNYVSGESMFYTEPNASKIALVTLMEHLNNVGITWLDTQMVTPIVKTLGGREIPRDQYIKKLNQSLSK
jgi:leucyl/phenylalanyl-tRNA--protein transferase